MLRVKASTRGYIKRLRMLDTTKECIVTTYSSRLPVPVEVELLLTNHAPGLKIGRLGEKSKKSTLGLSV